jgi:hypothetical protein
LPPDRSECGIWPFEAVKEYLSFIIDEDVRGRPVEHSCNPALLANNFGANPGAPHYLTPVFFQREVLRKYYENSNQYEIEDGSVECTGMWHLRADNNHADHVVVFLGDLGRDLPTSEQRHWRHHNVLPEDRELSETAIRRSFLGEWADAELPDFLFKHAYAAANEAWLAALAGCYSSNCVLTIVMCSVRCDFRSPTPRMSLTTKSWISPSWWWIRSTKAYSRVAHYVNSRKRRQGSRQVRATSGAGELPFVARDLADSAPRSKECAHEGKRFVKAKTCPQTGRSAEPKTCHGSFSNVLYRVRDLTDIAKFETKPLSL